jgi:ribonuclease-3
MDQAVLRRIEQVIGVEFSNKDLLIKAFTHSSAAANRTFSNERQEFLGDAILGLVVCQTLFERFPHYLEGDLTKIKSMLVSRRTCAKIIKELDIQKFQQIGKGMAASRALGGSVAAGLFEAIIAAIYIEAGFDASRDFILRCFMPLIEKADAQESQGNYKSMLQQHAQQDMNATPSYLLLDEKGPDHNKCFESAVVVGEQTFKSAWGVNKKEAEQKAAFNALIELGLIEDPDAVKAT